jgi:hypothetical protein
MMCQAWKPEPGRLVASRSELGERHCEWPLNWHWNKGEVEELVRVGTQQTSEIADGVVVAWIGREHKQIAEELPNAKHGAKLDREGTPGLGFEGVHDAWRNTNVLSGLHASGASMKGAAESNEIVLGRQVVDFGVAERAVPFMAS